MREVFRIVWVATSALCWALPAAQAQTLQPKMGETTEEYRARIGAAQSRAPAATSMSPKVGETKADFEARLQGRPPADQDGAIEIRADRRGQFITQATVRGQKLSMLVDTGASAVALPYEVAQRLGFKLSDADFSLSASTANGSTKVAAITLDEVRVGDITIRNVGALVGKPGALGETALLGMTFLSKLRKYEIANGVLTLVR
jgi:aspartyl protease family protein